MSKRLPQYKYIYADTNVVSDICKSKNLMNIFLHRYSLSKYLFCFSTYTLYEISKNHELMREFQKFYSIFPCVVIVSYFPLAMKEIEYLEKKVEFVDPILISPQGIKVEGKPRNPRSLEILISRVEVQESFKTVKKYTDLYFEELKGVFNSEEFNGVSKESCNLAQFISRFKNYELRHRFLGGQKLYHKFEKNKIIGLSI